MGILSNFFKNPELVKESEKEVVIDLDNFFKIASIISQDDPTVMSEIGECIADQKTYGKKYSDMMNVLS